MKLIKNLLFAALLALAFPNIAMAQTEKPFAIGDKTFLLNGKPFVVKAAEVHYPRIPRPYWEHRIKMCKALGMNTLCLYVFWNIHEQQEGVFDFTGQNDVAEFCRLAQKNGMYVIVRPGPYVCAEWEMGGLPWWLLKKKDIRLRERDPYFMERVRIFEKEVGKQLASLTIENGGPIIMVQVENEYGSYGVDKPYVSEIRDIVKASGFDKVTLFQCDWSSNFTNNGLDDLVWTMNFGTGANIDEQFRRLKELRPNSPLMCSEFWSGWFDKWGARHETRKADDMVAGIDEMLSKGISFSLYMTHGGTSFGHWAGANSPGFAPDVTSYDYDAPINEWGLPTEKYWTLRRTMEKYYDGKKLPAVPKAPASLISVPKFELKEYAPLANGIDKTIESRDIKTMEEMDMGWGSMIYETTLPAVPTSSLLTINDCHDFAQIFIDGKYIGKIDRVKNEKSITIPAVTRGQRLTILIEAMGRINFGRAIKDFKGITDRVTLSTETDGHPLTYDLKNWRIATLPIAYTTATKALTAPTASPRPSTPTASPRPSTPTASPRPSATVASDFVACLPTSPHSPGYYRGTFTLKKPGDTFINMEAFGKGMVYINGHAIGRFWSIGPQQTLYVPGCWLKKGTNEVIVLDIVGPSAAPTAFCQSSPELDKLNLEKSNKHNNPGDRPDLNSAKPVVDLTLKAGNGWQTINFPSVAKGRYVAIECLSTHSTNQVAIAELYLQSPDGKRLSREPWTTKYADSENEVGNHTGDKVYDLQESTYWQTQRGADFPHLLVIDLSSVQSLKALEYLPRAEQGAPGSIKQCRIFVY